MRCVEAESRDQRHLGLVKWRGLICDPEEDHQEGYEREGTTVEMSDRGVSLSSKATDSRRPNGQKGWKEVGIPPHKWNDFTEKQRNVRGPS